MDLKYSSEQDLLRDSAFGYLSSVYDYHARCRIVAGKEAIDRSIWAKFAELGWLALPIPEEDEGIGGDAVDLSVVMEALGSRLVVEPFLPTVVLGAGLIDLLATGEQRAILAEVAQGTAMLALAHQERGVPFGSPRVETRAERSGEGWSIRGAKILAIGAGLADHVLVPARISGAIDDAEGVGVFVVSRGTPGLELTEYPIADGRRAADLSIDIAGLSDSALLGGCENALPALEQVIDKAIAASCAYVVGGLDMLIRLTRDYTAGRSQFGKPLGRFQVVQHRLAEMQVKRIEARAAMQLAAIRCDGPRIERIRAISAAKVKVSEAARYIAHQAVQLHGGMGLTEELSVGTYLKHVLTFERLLGDTDDHLRRYAQLLADGRIDVRRGLVNEGAEA
ncbi:acyl-CoA dehydrogenase [Novosphingobium indicum]|uniref:Acyl-CoA dehydrogenase n=1 Tax=Novosphingobium indicum TaxID=462949 RepID=A0ABQ2K1N2_9SPHN|nr:acyl-CoA dehydrogenase family protein [Novosphingobium indicum]GGN61739.1 acyl-CoA dehydrogenase [Novosphingobium indicum]